MTLFVIFMAIYAVLRIARALEARKEDDRG